MTERETLLRLCLKGMEDHKLFDQQYKDRLRLEFREIDLQGFHDYFLDLYRRQARFAHNENNLFVAYLLGLVNHFDISQLPKYSQGEFPDIDMDFLPKVQEHLRHVWAPQTFGRDNVCDIGTYGTLGIKSAVLDMTKVHGLPKDEIQIITREMKDKYTDEDGKTKQLEWDKAIELYPDFAAYCEKHKDIASAASILVDRNKSGGVHAGGLIISSKRIDDFVPLEVRSVSKENKYGVIVSAWGEGQHTQDLQPVGLVKFDVLVVDGLMQIALACHLIRQRRGIEHISALPGKRNWSDTSFLNDPASMAMANHGDLKCIFQFDSEGMRKLVRAGGVTRFDDLAAYSALYRPGPLGAGMAEHYCKRKKGREDYTIHPLLEPILGKTYGIQVYQEQVMEVLNAVGNIPKIHTEKVRKAISKKKLDEFVKYKVMFLKNGQRNLSQILEYVQNIWNQIESFADYGFNKSHSYAYTFISAMQLHLKAHYAPEFYNAVLACEDDAAKIKEYKIDAAEHGVQIMPVHINRSKKTFSIHDSDENIYFGFSNLKKIGEAVADRIVDGQPYSSFVDFLERFGTEANVLNGLISLGIFEENYDREVLHHFYEHFKNVRSVRRDADHRFEVFIENSHQELREILKEHSPDPSLIEPCARFHEDAYQLWTEYFEKVKIEQSYNYRGEQRKRTVTLLKLLEKVRTKRELRIKEYENLQQEWRETPLSLETFDPAEVKAKPNEKVAELLKKNPKLAEAEYYGFQWIHELEESPDYTGKTIDSLLMDVEDRGIHVGCIEVKILSVESKQSKKGHTYHTAQVEDAHGKSMFVTIWNDDYVRFKDELRANTLVRMRVNPPNGKWNRLTFESWGRQERYKHVPKEKDNDCRLYLMRRGEPKKPKTEDLTDCKPET